MEKVLVLANSVMHHKTCIAGKIISTGEWIRLKGDDINGISMKEECLSRNSCYFKDTCDREYKCKNYKTADLLDIIEVEINEKSEEKEKHQTENYQFDTSIPWSNELFLKKNFIHDWVDEVDNLWDSYSKSDRIHKSNLPDNSLYFVKAEISLFIKIVDNKRRRRAQVKIGDSIYDLAVTSKNFNVLYEKYSSKSFKGYVTISLGEIFEENDCAYKLVAGIIEI